MTPEDLRSSPLVDVGITAFRRATFIREAIDSVLAQTFEPWTLTIFENGAGGGDIEEAVTPYLADPRVTYSASGEEVPVDVNFTRAIGHGTAPYVALLHDDDRWRPDFLHARARALGAEEECAFAFSAWVQIDETGAACASPPISLPEGVLPQRDLATLLMRQNPIIGSTTLVRRSAYEAVGAAFDGRWFYCDWEMWARLAARFPAYYLARRDIEFRRHPQANSYSTPVDPQSLLQLTDHIAGLLGASGDRSPGSANPARQRAHVLLTAASDAYTGGGWKACGPLYSRALREYPPCLFERRSLRILGYTVFGRTVCRGIARSVRRLTRRRETDL